MQKRAEQLEIFSPVNNYTQAAPKKFQFSFLTHVRANEKIILIFIGLLIIGLVSFSFGVEHGKKISMRKTVSDNFDLAMKKPVVVQQNYQALLEAPGPKEEKQNIEKPKPLVHVKQIIITKIEKPKIEKQKAEKTKVAKPKTQVAQGLQPKKEGISISAYTIQVASFKVKNEALKEVDSLKKRGFNSVVLNKGSHIIICVGNYSSKEKATSILEKLKKNYQDSFIRRL